MGSPPVWLNPALHLGHLLLCQAAARSQTIEVDIALTTAVRAILVNSAEAATGEALVPDDAGDESTDGAGAVFVHDVGLDAVFHPISVCSGVVIHYRYDISV
jgi:hypothetical protein